jgi:two-component system NarL family sensor kinase
VSREQREIGVLRAVSEALNSSPDVRQALDKTLSLVADLLGLRTGWVWLVDEETGNFYDAVERELPPYLQERVRMAGRRNCWCLDDFRSGELTPTNIDVLECSRLQPAFRRKSATAMTAGLRYHASIPLYFQDKRLGIINVSAPEWRKLTGDELRLLSTIANQVGIAIERARLAEDATRLARAEERARIAREIHDTLAQGLTAIALNIEGAMHHLESRPEQARERLERALAMARENLEEARRSVLDLRTTPLAGRPLAEAIAALARAFTSETGITVTVEADSELRLPLRMEAELFRIAQEALTNVRKHARARHVQVSLRSRARSVTLTVRDDGLGVVRNGTSPGGHGVIGMRERAKLLGGTLQISGRADEGTAVRARVPLP